MLVFILAQGKVSGHVGCDTATCKASGPEVRGTWDPDAVRAPALKAGWAQQHGDRTPRDACPAHVASGVGALPPLDAFPTLNDLPPLD